MLTGHVADPPLQISPQSYSITPKGGNKPLIKSTNAEDYGMDQKSDDSTDDESAPRKPIPSWAEGMDRLVIRIVLQVRPANWHLAVCLTGVIEKTKF